MKFFSKYSYFCPLELPLHACSVSDFPFAFFLTQIAGNEGGSLAVQFSRCVPFYFESFEFREGEEEEEELLREGGK